MRPGRVLQEFLDEGGVVGDPLDRLKQEVWEGHTVDPRVGLTSSDVLVETWRNIYLGIWFLILPWAFGQSYNGSTIVNYDSRGVPD